jgi:hypothetical protein
MNVLKLVVHRAHHRVGQTVLAGLDGFGRTPSIRAFEGLGEHVAASEGCYANMDSERSVAESDVEDLPSGDVTVTAPV